MKKIVAILLVLLVGGTMVFGSSSKKCSNGHLYTGPKCSHCEECRETYTHNGSSDEWLKQCLPSYNNNN